MRLNSMCVACLFNRQKERVEKLTDEDKKAAYLKEVAGIIGNSKDEDSAPYLVYLFGKVYEKYFGHTGDFSEIKKEYNSYVMAMENSLLQEIEESSDPLRQALIYARIGNYIDFGAMHHVDKQSFLELFHDEEKSQLDEKVYQEFLEDCRAGKRFLLLCDNCGEIVLDKLFLIQLQKRFPHLKIQVMVRGGEVLNDATLEDAQATGMTELFEVISNGNSVAGNVEELLSAEGLNALQDSDVILSKGQANYETMNGCGRNIYYAFLCKCDWFIKKFDVPKNTGMFVREM